uniref:Uncharacterized protein n=1 Tax=Chromera velia CCMP2878 TaxID=1169474 RepID=A0A0G4HS94_9ALVE|eukprot:Cvel_8202.t1-p1 / transcript=Cvel_8202.t1 / gene=Cvel_8202 / organism=Chromera_velia_CCMP2878 / gene_product=hypothetical protein / transcript_product=hypothetical protein / location=Cvel_scaffold447:27019-28231(-) / protein_length=215 / sequence_SO=supercontig / SO=protein_coding / is_pseudo=false
MSKSFWTFRGRSETPRAGPKPPLCSPKDHKPTFFCISEELQRWREWKLVSGTTIHFSCVGVGLFWCCKMKFVALLALVAVPLSTAYRFVISMGPLSASTAGPPAPSGPYSEKQFVKKWLTVDKDGLNNSNNAARFAKKQVEAKTAERIGFRDGVGATPDVGFTLLSTWNKAKDELSKKGSPTNRTFQTTLFSKGKQDFSFGTKLKQIRSKGGKKK